MLIEPASAENGITSLSLDSTGSIDGAGAVLGGATALAARSQTGSIDLDASSSLNVFNSGGAGPDGVTAPGDVSLRSSGSIASTAPIGGADVSLTSDQLNLGSSLTATGTASIAPRTASTPVDLAPAAATSGDLDVSAQDLAQIHAASLDIGSAATGRMTIAGPVSTTGSPPLALTAAGGFGASAGGSIAASSLALTDEGTAGRPWAITPSTISDGIGQPIPYSGTAQLAVQTGSGADSIALTVTHHVGRHHGRAARRDGVRPAHL
jgi:hypothetical protein